MNSIHSTTSDQTSSAAAPPPAKSGALLNVAKLAMERLVEFLKKQGFEENSLNLFTIEQLSTLTVTVCLVDLEGDKLLETGHALQKGNWEQVVNGFKTHGPILQTVRTAVNLMQKKGPVEELPERGITLEDSLKGTRKLAEIQEKLTKQLSGIFDSIEKELKEVEKIFKSELEASKNLTFKYKFSKEMTKMTDRTLQFTTTLTKSLHRFSLYFSAYRDQIENDSTLFCSTLDDAAILFCLPEWTKHFDIFQKKSLTLVKESIKFTEDTIDSNYLMNGIPWKNERTEAKFRAIQTSTNDIITNGLRDLGPRINEIGLPVTFSNIVIFFKTIMELSGSEKVGRKKGDPLNSIIASFINDTCQKLRPISYSQFNPSTRDLIEEKRVTQHDLEQINLTINPLYSTLESIHHTDFTQETWITFFDHAASLLEGALSDTYERRKQFYQESTKKSRIDYMGKEIELFDKDEIYRFEDYLKNLNKFETCVNLLFDTLRGHFKIYQDFQQQHPRPASDTSWQSLIWLSNERVHTPTRVKKRKILPPAVEKAAPPPEKAPEIKVKQVELPHHVFIESIENSLKKGPYEADALYHLFHSIKLVEMIDHCLKRGIFKPLQPLIAQLDNALALSQEQIVTPQFLDRFPTESVTHNLHFMNRKLNILTPFVCNFASQGFRYPNSHYRQAAKPPAWLETMVKPEIDPVADVTSVKERAAIALTYIAGLQNSSPSEIVQWIKEGSSIELTDSDWKFSVPKEKLASLIQLANRHEIQITNGELISVWKDMTARAKHLLETTSLMQELSHEKYLSLYAQNMVMSAQYFVELCGQVLNVLNNDPLRTHRLKIYSDIYQWSDILTKKDMETLDELDIGKGSDYPHRWLHHHPDWEPPIGLKLISSAYAVSTIADRCGEGFGNKEHSPAKVRAQMLEFLTWEIDLMHNLFTKSVLQKFTNQEGKLSGVHQLPDTAIKQSTLSELSK